MSPGSCTSLVWILFLLGTIWRIDGAAIQNSTDTVRAPNMPPLMQRNSSDTQRNGSLPKQADPRPFQPNPVPPNQPFGTNSPPPFPMPPMMAPPGFMFPQPPLKPILPQQPGMVPPGMAQFPSASSMQMNNPNQQQSGQPPQQTLRREVPQMMNATGIPVPNLNSNTSRPNNNTRRDTEQSAEATTAKSGQAVPAVKKPFQEPALGNDKPEMDGTKLKQQSTPTPNPFAIPHPMPLPMTPFNQGMAPFTPILNTPFFVDPMGRLMMLVPVDPSRLPFLPPNVQQAPQGPPIPASPIPQMQIKFGQPPLGSDFAKQPIPPTRVAENKNSTSS